LHLLHALKNKDKEHLNDLVKRKFNVPLERIISELDVDIVKYFDKTYPGSMEELDNAIFAVDKIDELLLVLKLFFWFCITLG